MTLEDEFCDIVKKARLGQGCSISQVAERSGVREKELEILEKGKRSPEASEILAIGKALHLKPQPLTQVALEGWVPKGPPEWVEPEGPVVTIEGDIGGYAVKGYVFFDRSTKKAVFIDTAYNAGKMLNVLQERGLTLTGVCLTHGHTDHAGGLDQILEVWPVPVYLGEGDFPLLPWKPDKGRVSVPVHRQTIEVGNLTLHCLATPGHTPGGLCYNSQLGEQALCFVGDTLFAGSIGRSNPFSLYAQHLDSVRTQVLSLPQDTVLLPGHGPATTVIEEVAHNPFG